MDDRNLDLVQYAELYSLYRLLIRQSASPSEALDHATAFLSQVEGMFDKDIASAFHEEVHHLWVTFPARAKNLGKYQELVEVLLGQAVDFYWYAQYPQYATSADVDSDDSLCSFRRFNEDFDVRFMYVQYYEHILMRVPNSLRLRYRRLMNHPGKYTQGLTTTRCRKAMVGLINQLAADVASQVRRNKPFRVLINSVMRTVEYQNSLAKLGYVAPRYSAHTAGYAVDVERLWYERHDRQAYEAIENVLGALFAKQAVNLIEEGTHWHVCLNPDRIRDFEAMAQEWVRQKG